jgi:phytoene/squalene synthetase
MRDGEPPERARAIDDARRAIVAHGAAGAHGDGDARGAGAHSDGDSRGAADQGDGPRMLSPSRYLAWLYSPEAQQPVLAKLCEIESAIASSLRPGIDHHVAHARLQWWQEECERCAQGRPVHPLTRELVKAYGSPAVAGQPSPLAGISGFVDAAVWDLAGATFETRKELSAYCARWSAAMFETAAGQVTGTESGATAPVGERQPTDAAHAARAIQAARTMRASDSPGSATPDTTLGSPAPVSGSPAAASGAEPAISRWRVLGAAVREIELLADLAREAHAGRVRVPLDELDRAGVEVGSLAKPPWPEALVTLLRERHEALRATIAESVSTLGREEQTGFRGVLVWTALAWGQSARAQRALPGIILPRRYHALADGWHAWRAARRAAAGKLRLS